MSWRRHYRTCRLDLAQRTYPGEYDHRKVVEKLKGDKRVRQLSNEIF